MANSIRLAILESYCSSMVYIFLLCEDMLRQVDYPVNVAHKSTLYDS